MARILIIYETQEGHTETITQFMVDELTQAGHEVSAATVDDPVSLLHYDAVIIGASIHYGSFSLKFVEYIQKNHDSLKMLPSAFFSVSMAAMNANKENVEKVQSYLNSLVDATGWHPDTTASFAGALKYSEYGYLKKMLVKAIAKKEHLGVNTKQDVEYTDWQKVKYFIDDFVASVPSRASMSHRAIDLKLLEERGA